MDKRGSIHTELEGRWGFQHFGGCAVKPRDCGPEVCLHPVPLLNAG